MTVFEDAHGYLNSAIRVYVNATTTLDKLFAVKLVVLSMIIAVDALMETVGTSSNTPFQSHLEDSNFFLPMAAYEQRVTELQMLEENYSQIKDLSLTIRLQKSIDTLKFVYGKYGFRSLLSLNIKEFINNALFFILEIKEVVET
ncbi:MAG: hypothetical protein ACW97Z_09465 [Candidatus Hodarchaeales archaeon]